VTNFEYTGMARVFTSAGGEIEGTSKKYQSF